MNVLARELRIPLSNLEAIRTIAEGTPKPIDLGIANGRYFTLMAGFGFDAEVVTNVLQPIKDWIGASAYILKGLETLATYQATESPSKCPRRPTQRRPSWSSSPTSRPTRTISTSPRWRAPDDGLLDICVFERPITDRIGFMRQVAEVFINRHMYHKAVRFFRTTARHPEIDPETFVQLDGDPFGKTPVEIADCSAKSCP